MSPVEPPGASTRIGRIPEYVFHLNCDDYPSLKRAQEHYDFAFGKERDETCCIFHVASLKLRPTF